MPSPVAQRGMAVTEQARSAYRELMRTWGAKPAVVRHWDEAERHCIDVASCLDSPARGCTAVGTVGLSDHELGPGGPRVEIIGAFPSAFASAPNVAATCAFNAFKDRVATRPDAIHPDVMRIYHPSTTLPHILLTDPFLWDDGPRTLVEGSSRIAWLMMVPIAQSERAFAAREGAGALTTLFADRQIDIFDLDRPAVA